jgi:hypothetical protein
MFYKEIISAHSEDHSQHTKKCVQKAGFINIDKGEICNDPWVLKR